MPPFPVFCSPLWALKDAREDAMDDWLDKGSRRPNIMENFREMAARDWVAQLVETWKLDDYSVAELADILGIDKSQVSRLRKDYSASIAVLAMWATKDHQPIPPPNIHRWAMSGVVAAVNVTRWLELTNLTRVNRTELADPPSIHEAFLLIVLFDEMLQDHWHSLTCRYANDLYMADNDPSLSTFLRRFRNGYERLMQQHPAVIGRFSLYFPAGHHTQESRWVFCRDLDAAWRQFHASWTYMWAVVEQHTPWMGACPNQDDEAA